MFPRKKNVLLLVSLLKAYGVRQVILSPGSRNAPLIHSFMLDDFFHCQMVVDERNAAFMALGMMQATQEPVAICCTSGTALLNYAPAVAEAYYQQLPLIVLSADRSPEWINQMDGQTIPQPGVFGAMAIQHVNLPEVVDASSDWYCQRLCHEALLAATSKVKGPVHINIPLSEPLFDYSVQELPVLNKITHSSPVKHVPIDKYAQVWRNSAKRLLVIGQLLPSSDTFLEKLKLFAEKRNCVILAEHLSNIQSPYIFSCFDTLIASLPNDELSDLSPDLLITMGGHVVSKRLKHWLRDVRPRHHWYVAYQPEVVDLYQSLTDLIETDHETWVDALSNFTQTGSSTDYYDAWKSRMDKINEPNASISYSEIGITGQFLRRLPSQAQLHLANSSSVRNAQLFQLPEGVRVYCNRGTNGIDGNLPSAIGFAMVSKDPVYLLIGDLSFFYSLSALWNIRAIKNLRILLINNGGGGLFHVVPGLKQSVSISAVSAAHQEDASQWAKAAGLKYVKATNADELESALDTLMNQQEGHAVIIEACISLKGGQETLQNYYQQQKDIFHGNK